MLEKLPNKWYTISNLGFNQKGSLYIYYLFRKKPGCLGSAKFMVWKDRFV